MPDDKTRVLIRRLIAATERGTLDWEATGGRMFKVSTPAATVIVQSGNEDGGHPYFVDVRNADGVILGSGNSIPGAGYADWEEEIAQLYGVARNKALGIDTTLDQFADELDLPPDPSDIPF